MSGHNVFQEMFDGGNVTTDPGSGKRFIIDRDFQIIETVVAGGAEGRLLGDPVRSGQFLILTCKTAANPCIIVSDSAMDDSAHTVLTLDAVGETVLFVSIPDSSGFRWLSLVASGATFS